MMNFKLRLNLYTVVAIISAVLTAIHVDPQSMTTWPIVWQQIINLFSNPVLLATTIITIAGVLHDPTTKGLGDSEQAKNYDKPN